MTGSGCARRAGHATNATLSAAKRGMKGPMDALRVCRIGTQIARGLQAAGYATDPNYADKLARIINGNTLRTALAASSARSA